LLKIDTKWQLSNIALVYIRWQRDNMRPFIWYTYYAATEYPASECLKNSEMIGFQQAFSGSGLLRLYDPLNKKLGNQWPSEIG